MYQDPIGSRTLGYSWFWGWGGGTIGVLSTPGCTKDTLAYSIDYYTAGTFTVNIATPGVFTYNNHGFIHGQKVQFTTTGALPTGVSANTTYYIRRIDANTFYICTSLANVAATIYVNTSGSQSGIHSLICGSGTLSIYKATP